MQSIQYRRHSESGHSFSVREGRDRGMAANAVLISSGSREVLFSGNLLKAPPLNRRAGRKKWHDRYFLLRANKTLALFKTRKAAEAGRTPRRVIDLRSCINLEMGLEYKALQHVFCLGTFKRSFFFAAASDMVMLHWAYMLEKVKNAQEDDYVEVLDVGLRRKDHDHNAVHRVKSSPSIHQMVANTPKKKRFFNNAKSKSSMALAHFPCESSETINLRKSSENSVEDLPPVPPIRTSSLGSRDSTCSSQGSTRCRDSSTSRRGSESSSAPADKGPQPVRIPLAIAIMPHEQARQGNLVSPSLVPKPTERSFRTSESDAASEMHEHLKAGFVVRVPPLSRIHPAIIRECSSTDEPETPSPSAKKPQEFVPREGSLQRGRAMRMGSKAVQEERSKVAKEPAGSRLEVGGHVLAGLRTNMKRSLRYRKITLRPETPLFADSADASSDEETEGEAVAAPVSPPLLRAPPGGRRLKVVQRARNSYSKVTVYGVRGADATSGETPPSGDETTLRGSMEDFESRASIHLSCVSLSPPEVLDLTELPPAAPMYASMHSINSLDNILVDPPEMFTTDPQPGRGAQQAEGNGASAGPVAEAMGVDRNSTESNDTGYTSSTSPSGTGRPPRDVVPAVPPGYATPPQLPLCQDPPPCLPSALSQSSYNHSQTSIASGDIRCYVPLVFHSPSVGSPRQPPAFAIEVCLVENSDDLIKNLISLKVTEGFSLVECEEVEGGSVTHFGDDFTVQTALEDLEFGFTVTKSTQKDLFMRKVRQFHFEIRELFGSPKKQFSCDVEIRHGGKMTVLPIELERDL